MNIVNVFGLLGGLALFLYGMNMMSSGMEAAAGNRLKGILERLTANRWMGVLAGAVITAVIQSSSATTVMVVGFVNSGMMTLQQAVWVIMGANIGTTITGQLIALDAGAVAPLVAFIGVALVIFSKNGKARNVGSIFAGLGILFIGMDMMGEAMTPLQSSQGFINLMTHFSNPFMGILAGTVFTAVIQSSSASVGILQALAASGIIGLPNAVYVLFGQNIGTCITAVLAAIGTSRNAKRTTIIHLSFNLIGTVVFTLVCMFTPLTAWVAGVTPGNPPAQIANMHTLFNVVTTLLLIPFGTLLAKLACRILPDLEKEETGMRLLYISREKNVPEGAAIGVSAINLEQTGKEISRMLDLARKNVYESFCAFIERNPGYIAAVEQTEDYVDFLNREICRYISKAIVHENTKEGGQAFSAYFKITSNIERISDHAMNICGYAAVLKEQNIHFSEEAMKELKRMQAICDRLLAVLLRKDGETDAIAELSRISAMEQEIDDMTRQYRNNMLLRIQNGSCNEEGSIVYSEMLTDFERIGDHALNISEQLTEMRCQLR